MPVSAATGWALYVNLPRFEFVRLRHHFKGWVRSDFPIELIAETLKTRDRFDDLKHSPQLLKDDGKSRVVRETFEDRAGKRWDIVVKRVRYSLPLRRLGFLVFASPASRSLRGALLLQESGVLTARPLAAIEPCGWEGLGTSFYFAEAIEGKTLYVLWRELCDEGAAKRHHLLKQLSAFVCRLHDSGVYQRDLKGSNILVQKSADGEDDFVLVDTDGVRCMHSLRWRKRIKNLIQVCRLHRLSERDKVWFLREYFRRCDIPGRRIKSSVKRVVRLTRSNSRIRRQA